MKIDRWKWWKSMCFLTLPWSGRVSFPSRTWSTKCNRARLGSNFKLRMMWYDVIWCEASCSKMKGKIEKKIMKGKWKSMLVSSTKTIFHDFSTIPWDPMLRQVRYEERLKLVRVCNGTKTELHQGAAEPQSHGSHFSKHFGKGCLILV